MATFKSNLASRGLRYRGAAVVGDTTVRARVAFAPGTVLTTADVIELVPIGENQVITSIELIGLDLGAAEADIGHLQLLDRDGNPVVVETKGPAGPAGTKFASPNADVDAFAAAQALDGADTLADLGFVVPGPIMLGATVTTGATLANGGELHVIVTMLSEMAPEGEYEGENAYNYKYDYPL